MECHGNKFLKGFKFSNKDLLNEAWINGELACA